MGWLKTNSQSESEWQEDVWLEVKVSQTGSSKLKSRCSCSETKRPQGFVRLREEWGDLSVTVKNHNHARLWEDVAADRSCCQWMQPRFKGKLRRIPWNQWRESTQKKSLNADQCSDLFNPEIWRYVEETGEIIWAFRLETGGTSWPGAGRRWWKLLQVLRGGFFSPLPDRDLKLWPLSASGAVLGGGQRSR